MEFVSLGVSSSQCRVCKSIAHEWLATTDRVALINTQTGRRTTKEIKKKNKKQEEETKKSEKEIQAKKKFVYKVEDQNPDCLLSVRVLRDIIEVSRFEAIRAGVAIQS